MKKTALQEIEIEKERILKELILKVNSPEKKDDKHSLFIKAKNEIQKVEQLVFNNKNNKNLSEKHNKKLNDDLILKAELIKTDLNISQKLLDRIENNINIINDLNTEIESSITEINISNTDVKNAIAELRKVDPRKAAELENSINLKAQKNTKITTFN